VVAPTGGEPPPAQDLERAVSLLCAEGLVLVTRLTGLPPYYRLNPHQRAAISRFLSGP